MSLLALSFGFGLITASVLALAAVGLSLQFGVTNHAVCRDRSGPRVYRGTP